MHFTKDLPLKQRPNALTETPSTVRIRRIHNTRHQHIDILLMYPLVPVFVTATYHLANVLSESVVTGGPVCGGNAHPAFWESCDFRGCHFCDKCSEDGLVCSSIQNR